VWKLIHNLPQFRGKQKLKKMRTQNQLISFSSKKSKTYGRGKLTSVFLNRISYTIMIMLVIFFTAGCKDKDNNPTPQTSNQTGIASTSPSSNNTSVDRNKTISVVFNTAMDPATVTTSNFSLQQGTTDIPGTVALSADGKTATFNPTNTLQASTTYKVTMTTGVKDLSGNPLPSNSVWSFTTGGSTTGEAAVNLGSAGNYVILAKTAINNNPTSAITGNLGLSPAATSYITGLALTNATGYATSSQVTGNIYAADMAMPTSSNLTTAVSNMITAYNDAAGRPSPDFSELGTGNIGGKTLSPGLYKWTSTVTMPTNITISGGANDVWIFQIAGNLTQSSGVNITLTGGAQAKNIFWQVAGTVTLGTTSHFEGIILSKTGITMGRGASMNGRALAQTAVILDGNTLVQSN
jgi:hypothetical protein